MSSVLPEWYGHDDKAIKKIVTAGTIAVDTNVLLDLYRVGREQREQILSTLEAVRDRLFVPFQVALEYQRKRLSVAADNQSQYENLVDNAIALAEKQLDRLRDEQHKAAVRAIFDKAREEIQRQLTELREEQVITFDEVQKDDPIRTALDELIDDEAVGQRPTPKALDDLKAKALQRIENSIPPGYLDAKKEDPTGDCLIWFELLDHVDKSNRPLLFVTNDSKEDWYRERIRGRAIGPRVELIAEMTTASKGQLYHQVPLDLFLDLAVSYLDAEVEETTIEAVRNIARPSELELDRETLTSLAAGALAASATGNQLAGQEAVNAALEAYASKLYDPSTLGRYPPGSSLSDLLAQGNYGVGRSLLGSPTLAESLSARIMEAYRPAFDASKFASAFDASKITSAFDASKITSGLLSQIGIPTAQELMAQARAQLATAARTPTPTPAKQAKHISAKKTAPAPAKKASAKKSEPRKNPAKKPRPAKENG
jgi:PIN like domain